MTQPIDFTSSSGNVFEDLGFEEPGVMLIKAQLIQAIADVIRERGLTQAEAAELLDADQPKVSLLMRGRVTGFSTERLLRYIGKLGLGVKLEVIQR